MKLWEGLKKNYATNYPLLYGNKTKSLVDKTAYNKGNGWSHFGVIRTRPIHLTVYRVNTFCYFLTPHTTRVKKLTFNIKWLYTCLTLSFSRHFLNFNLPSIHLRPSLIDPIANLKSSQYRNLNETDNEFYFMMLCNLISHIPMTTLDADMDALTPIGALNNLNMCIS